MLGTDNYHCCSDFGVHDVSRHHVIRTSDELIAGLRRAMNRRFPDQIHFLLLYDHRKRRMDPSVDHGMTAETVALVSIECILCLNHHPAADLMPVPAAAGHQIAHYSDRLAVAAVVPDLRLLAAGQSRWQSR